MTSRARHTLATNWRAPCSSSASFCSIPGYGLTIPILWTIGIIVLIIGAVLWILGAVGRPSPADGTGHRRLRLRRCQSAVTDPPTVSATVKSEAAPR